MVGGASGSGKSSFLLSEGLTIAKDDGVVVYLSLEMSTNMLALRSLSAMTQLPAKKIERGQLTKESLDLVREKIEEFNKIPIYFYDQVVNSEEWKIILESHQNKNGLDACMIDYIGLLTDQGTSDYEKMTAKADAMKSQATYFDVPFIAAAQLNRASLSGRPTMSSLKSSGQVEANAGAVIFPYRPIREEGAENGNKDPNVEDALLLIAKNRHGEQDVEIPVEFVPKTMTWRPKKTEIKNPPSAKRDERSIA